MIMALKRRYTWKSANHICTAKLKKDSHFGGQAGGRRRMMKFEIKPYQRKKFPKVLEFRDLECNLTQNRLK
ncbi:hypothetical protein BpHYR1_010218 [Brachionus plicatilis]|uniref:Uncharacterized protein n=1 Tax=Brachionus plicatilis TaxID=10195 RepID=A0A3M7PP48_BRAPC|nr:hypothetical protein BpHYR1_010218 [Brachionus plicatilis]